MKLFVGTYTEPGMGRAEGAYRLDFNEDTGALSMDAVFGGIANPSYVALALSADGGRMYCVHELATYDGAEGGAVSGYAIGPGGATLINTQSTRGGYPCHAAISPDGTLLSVANYGGGSLSVFSIAADGTLGEAQLIQHEGHGPNAQRQEAPHVHSSVFSPSGTHIIVADLGTDTVTSYPVREGTLDAGVAVAGHPGDGPRMFAYHGRLNLLYVLSEMGNNIATYDCGSDGTPTQWLCSTSTLPSGADTSGTAADVHLSADGRFLYASNRGHDSLTVFTVSEQSGDLALAQNIPCGGKTPRGFTLSPSGNWLLCGHQDSDTLTVFAIDKEKGTLTQQSTITLPSPVCLVFVP